MFFFCNINTDFQQTVWDSSVKDEITTEPLYYGDIFSSLTQISKHSVLRTFSLRFFLPKNVATSSTICVLTVHPNRTLFGPAFASFFVTFTF